MTAFEFRERSIIKLEEIKWGKHVWMKDHNGEIDLFAYEHGFHKGSYCIKYHQSFCGHCNPEIF